MASGSSSNGNGNDFRSLLSTFQAATQTNVNISKKPSSHKRPNRSESTQTTKNTSSENGNSHTASNALATMKQRTERLWRISQIRSVSLPPQHLQSQSQSQSQAQTQPVRIHIAVCACIVDTFPHESIWKSWMDHPDPQSQSQPQSHQSYNHTQNYDHSTGPRIEASAELYVHAKHPERIPSSQQWTRSKLIPVSYRPNWNDVRIVRAMLALASHALRSSHSNPQHDNEYDNEHDTPQNENDTTTASTSLSPKTTHVLFVTESCIPIASLLQVATQILSPQYDHDENHHNPNDATQKNTLIQQHRRIHRSFVQAYNAQTPPQEGRENTTMTRFDEQACWDVLSKYIPYEAIHKALPGWCLLSRVHMEQILDLPHQLSSTHTDTDDSNSSSSPPPPPVVELWPAFEQVWAPEEVYFPTALALIGAMPASSSSSSSVSNHNATGGDVIPKSLLHAKWNTRARQHKDRAHPLVYDDSFSYDLVRRIRDREGCVFMRKLKRPIDLSVWEDIVFGRSLSSCSSSSSFSNGNRGRKRQYSHHDHHSHSMQPHRNGRYTRHNHQRKYG